MSVKFLRKMACNIFLTFPNNVKMPALGFGTWQSTGDDMEKALDAALEIGYRHIDTATRYENEDAIGRVLKRWLDSGKLKREDLFMTTKLPSTDMRPDTVEARIKDSLDKLQLDYIDLYLIHFPLSIVKRNNETVADTEVSYLDIWKKMEEQVDAGRAKSIGVSNFSIEKLDKILKMCRIKPANNQVEMHVYFQQKELVDFAKKHGVTIVAYSPLGTRGYNDYMKTHGRATKVLPDLLNDETVKSIANKYSKTPAQILLRFLLQLGVSAIPKSGNPGRMKENFSIFDFQINNADMDELRGLDKGVAGRIFDFRWGRVHEHPDFDF